MRLGWLIPSLVSLALGVHDNGVGCLVLNRDRCLPEGLSMSKIGGKDDNGICRLALGIGISNLQLDLLNCGSMMWHCHNDCGLGNLVGTTLLNPGVANG